MDNLSEKVAELSKRRGFFFQSNEAYGGVSGFQTFGPEGAELKRNIENMWRRTFSRSLGHREIEARTDSYARTCIQGFRSSGRL